MGAKRKAGAGRSARERGKTAKRAATGAHLADLHEALAQEGWE
jgi:hypothetical protein